MKGTGSYLPRLAPLFFFAMAFLAAGLDAGFRAGTFALEAGLADFTVFGAYQVGKISTRITRLQHQFTIRETLYGVATDGYLRTAEFSRLKPVWMTVD